MPLVAMPIVRANNHAAIFLDLTYAILFGETQVGWEMRSALANPTMLDKISQNPDVSDRKLAKMLGVSRTTIWNYRRTHLHLEERRKRIAVERLLPRMVRDVLTDSQQGRKLVSIALARGLSLDQVIGIRQGGYDRYATNGKLVRVGGKVQLYDTKGYTPSGFSIKGALELSDDQQYVKCHECGNWFGDVGHHSRKVHGLRAADYKKKHGLKNSSALISEKLRSIHIEAAKKNTTMVKGNIANIAKANAAKAKIRSIRIAQGQPHYAFSIETQNARHLCAAQIQHDLRALADRLQRRPTIIEIEKAGFSRNVIAARFGMNRGDVSKALDSIFDKNLPRLPSGGRNWYSKEELIQMLREFHNQYKRSPSQSDCRRGLLPSFTTYWKYFGSWLTALKLAGIRPAPYKPWYSDQQLLAALKNFNSTYKRQPFRSDCRRGLIPMQETYAKRFGSWGKALRLAGMSPVKKGYRGIVAARQIKKRAARLNAPPVGITAEGTRA